MSSNATIYLIRHSEKPPKAAGSEDQTHLSTAGIQRSQALVQVFGQDSPYNISLVLTELPKKDGQRARPYLTVRPLVESLPGVELNTSIDREDAHGVAAAVRDYNGTGNILICWEHGQLQNIAAAIGVKDPPAFPNDRFDLIFTIPPPWVAITNVASQKCPGLDDVFAETHDTWTDSGTAI